MCLAIPKKVVEVNDNEVIVEAPNGNRQAVKSIVKLDIGDFCLTQQNVVIDKVSKEEALEIIHEYSKAKEALL